MLETLSNWAENLIVAIAIITIIEMLLPEGNNKKYIKIVCSIYILFCVVNPILSLSKYDYSNLKFDFNFQDTNNDIPNMIEVYSDAYETEIKNSLQEDGYEINEVIIDMSKDKINSIEIKVNTINDTDKNKLIQNVKENFEIEDVIIK